MHAEGGSLHFTLSLYIDAQNLPDDYPQLLASDKQMDVQHKMAHSLNLRWAIEPMFNDIADRERLGKVEDYVLSVRDGTTSTSVAFHIPSLIAWQTEGRTFEAEIGNQPVRPAQCRRFWYVHANGAISYHISFGLTYRHGPADFYFISLLQKVLAPKEFGPLRNNEDDLFPLKSVQVTDDNGKQASFWRFVAANFDRDAADLVKHFPSKAARVRDGRQLADFGGRYFDELITCDNVIEVPGLKLPRARAMFIFDDTRFLNDLLPKKQGKLRRACVTPEEFATYPAAIKARIAEASEEPVRLETAFLAGIPPAHLRYLFMAGFAQNIIDFVNQEAHEVLDSLDPIYPQTEEQEAESFFVRYANPRSFITFADHLRSLDLGSEHIGTCPYAFLIHVLAVHNEFMVRNYEVEADALVQAVEPAHQRRTFARAAQRFYDFHKRQYAHYYRYRSVNVFRYDTEQSVFEAIEQRRSIDRKVAEVERTVSNSEKFTRDLEERHRQEDARLFGWLAGVFTFCQVGFTLIEKTAAIRLSDPKGWSAWLAGPNPEMLLFLAVALGGGLCGAVVFVRWLGR